MTVATGFLDVAIKPGHGIYMSQWRRHITGGEVVTLPVGTATGLIASGFAELAPPTTGDD